MFEAHAEIADSHAGSKYAFDELLPRWLASMSPTLDDDIAKHTVIVTLGVHAHDLCTDMQKQYRHQCVLLPHWTGPDRMYHFGDDWYTGEQAWASLCCLCACLHACFCRALEAVRLISGSTLSTNSNMAILKLTSTSKLWAVPAAVTLSKLELLYNVVSLGYDAVWMDTDIVSPMCHAVRCILSRLQPITDPMHSPVLSCSLLQHEGSQPSRQKQDLTAAACCSLSSCQHACIVSAAHHPARPA